MAGKMWDKIAGTFEEEVYNPYKDDRNDTFRNALRRVASDSKTVADFGCGIGRIIPLLAENFKNVVALDISANCLEIAESKYSRFSNVDFRQCDLTTKSIKFPVVDVGISVNTVIMPKYRQRMTLFKNVSSTVREGGHLILVVPSLESYLFATFRNIDWNLKEMSNYRRAAAAADIESEATLASLRDGVVKLGGVMTKHYLREELIVLLNDLQWKIEETTKLEYNWTHYFESPPDWLREPFPWDWLVVCKKLKM